MTLIMWFNFEIQTVSNISRVIKIKLKKYYKYIDYIINFNCVT